MQATIVKLAVEDGQQVVKGDLVVVLEAMKMEQPIQAHKDGASIDATSNAAALSSYGRPPAHQQLTIGSIPSAHRLWRGCREVAPTWCGTSCLGERAR